MNSGAMVEPHMVQGESTPAEAGGTRKAPFGLSGKLLVLTILFVWSRRC